MRVFRVQRKDAKVQRRKVFRRLCAFALKMSAATTTELKPAPPPVERIKVKVDGRETEVPRLMPDPISGKPVPTTMIQACAFANVDVPHYCYHPRLPVAGN